MYRGRTWETDMSNTKSQTKRTHLAKLISRKSGATVVTLQNQLGWQPHTIRAEISRLRKSGLVVICTSSANGSIYRTQATVPAHEAT
jgi:predicted ArsR family transcriptional regulator